MAEEPTGPAAAKEPKPRKPRRVKQPPPEADAAPRAKPKSGAAKRSEKRGRELRSIEAGLSELLSFPAVPAAAFGDAWAVDHFSNRGPALAARITAECERSDQLRKVVLRLVEGQSYMLLAVELGLYAAPALAHYGLLPGAEQMGVPVLRRKAPPEPAASAHGARQAPAQPQGAPEAPTPPAGAQVAAEAAAEAAAAMNGELAEEDLGYATGVRPGEVPPPEEPPPIEFA